MSKKVTTMSDLNQNTIDVEALDIETVEAPINLSKDGDELFLELEQLSKNPERFLAYDSNVDKTKSDSTSDIECDIYSSLEDYCKEKDDTDLLRYFSCKGDDEVELDSDTDISTKSMSEMEPSATRRKQAGRETPTFVECPTDEFIEEQRKIRGRSRIVAHEGDVSLSKQAVQARENRQKKKRYVQGLEQSVSSLTSENKSLKKTAGDLQETVDSLKSEVSYLSSVLANQSTLASLLKNIGSTPGLNFRCTDLDGLIDSRTSSPERLAAQRKRPRCDDLEEDEQIKENKLFNKSLTASGQPQAKKTQLDHDYASDIKTKKKKVPTATLR